MTEIMLCNGYGLYLKKQVHCPRLWTLTKPRSSRPLPGRVD